VIVQIDRKLDCGGRRAVAAHAETILLKAERALELLKKSGSVSTETLPKIGVTIRLTGQPLREDEILGRREEKEGAREERPRVTRNDKVRS
jgi:hypothetical protein